MDLLCRSAKGPRMVWRVQANKNHRERPTEVPPAICFHELPCGLHLMVLGLSNIPNDPKRSSAYGGTFGPIFHAPGRIQGVEAPSPLLLHSLAEDDESHEVHTPVWILTVESRSDGP